MQEALNRAARQDETLSHTIIRRLRAGHLPQMVDWFDPMLLAKIGVREMVSGTMGQYADQRLMQAATDDASEQKLRERYDYSGATAAQMRFGEGLWVDYISDLGDGFEATYAMAYLMAQDRLEVQTGKGAAPPVTLPAGDILIMGGDQAYPQSSQQEYQDRLLDPYNWAFSTPNPHRKLFALPGNHDWYDGLGAFDSLFCSVRNLISKDKGKPIGGWRCQQHRSYWAIKLSEHWWIWGADIQLEGVFDDAQRDYFHIKSEQTGPGDNIIICLAEPSWSHDNYDNLHDIAYLARKHGAHVSAVLAGDWHHYSRYEQTEKSKAAKDLGVQFITCGGGGAFAHATHGLKDKLTLCWPDVEIEAKRGSSGAAPDLKHMAREAGTDASGGAIPPQPAPHVTGYGYEAAAIYPTKGFSRLLSLKNLWLPFHNWRFAVFVGCVYFLYAWVFQTSINPYDKNLQLAAQSNVERKSAAEITSFVEQIHDSAKSKTAVGENDVLVTNLIRSLDRWRRATSERWSILGGASAPARDSAIRDLSKRAAEFTLNWDNAWSQVRNELIDLRKKAPDNAVVGAIKEPGHGEYFGDMSARYAFAIERHWIGNSRKLAQNLKESAELAAYTAGPIAASAEAVNGDATVSEEVKRAAYYLAQSAQAAERQATAFASAIRPIDLWDVAEDAWVEIKDLNRLSIASLQNPAFFFLIIALWGGLIFYADTGTSSASRYVSKIIIGSLHFLAHMMVLLIVSAALGIHLSPTLYYLLAVSLASILGIVVLLAVGARAALILTPIALIVAIFIAVTDLGSSSVRSAWVALANLYAGPSAESFITDSDNWMTTTLNDIVNNPYVLNFGITLLFAFATIMVGGILGAFIFGIYWSIMSALFARHTGDAFGALGIRHYKHFLRLHFEEDRLTIYPIAVDKIPGRRGWRVPMANEAGLAHNPQIVPKEPLKPDLIEAPILIEAKGTTAHKVPRDGAESLKENVVAAA